MESDKEVSLGWVIKESLSEVVAFELCSECDNKVLGKECSR